MIQRLPISVLIAFALHTSTRAVYPDVLTCLAAANVTLMHNLDYDKFAWSGEPNDAVILRWESAFSKTNPITVPTVVEIEGQARRRAKPAEAWDNVTVRCGLNDAKVDAVEIVPGHDSS